MTGSERRAIRALRYRVGKLTGVRGVAGWRFSVSADRRYRRIDGQIWWDRKSKHCVIHVKQGMRGKLLLETVRHELAHWLRDCLPEESYAQAMERLMR